MSADPHNDWGTRWPPGPIEAQVRAALAEAERLVLHHETHSGGLVPACQLRVALGMGKRDRHAEETP